jgi:hypothetical protein
LTGWKRVLPGKKDDSIENQCVLPDQKKQSLMEIGPFTRTKVFSWATKVHSRPAKVFPSSKKFGPPPKNVF